MSPAETTITLVVVVGVAAVVIRMFSRDEKPALPGDVDAVDALLAEVSDADPATAGEVVAVSADGWAFVPDGHGVALVPHESEAQTGIDTSRLREGYDPAYVPPPPTGRLHPGDFAGARVRRIASDDEWRLEALGRDGDYRAWSFVTQDAAKAALDLIERRIVRVPLDEDGEQHPPSDADFDEARRADEETERALDSFDDE